MQINDQSRLLELDYRPLTDRVPHDLVERYEADHEASDREAHYDASQLKLGMRPWLRRLRLDTFARANDLTYAPVADPTPYANVGFHPTRGSASVADVLATRDGQVTVGSFLGPYITRSRTLTKFVAIFLGGNGSHFILTPRTTTDHKAADELQRHFTFEGEGWDASALTPLVMPEVARQLSPEDRARLPLDTQWAVQQAEDEESRQNWWQRRRARHQRRKQFAEVAKDGQRKLATSLFDEQLGRLIVQEALGFTVERHKTKLYVYKNYYDEDVLVKPEVLQQMFRIAALLGPGFARATSKR